MQLILSGTVLRPILHSASLKKIQIVIFRTEDKTVRVCFYLPNFPCLTICCFKNCTISVEKDNLAVLYK